MTDAEFLQMISTCSSMKELLIIALEDQDVILTSDAYYRDFRRAWLEKAEELVKEGDK